MTPLFPLEKVPANPPSNPSGRGRPRGLALLTCVLLSACATSEQRAYQELVTRLTENEKVNLDRLAAQTKARGDLPYHRKQIVLTSIAEAKLGLGGPQALQRYNGIGPWCAEFARWVYIRSAPRTNAAVNEELAKVYTSEQLEEHFTKHGRWIPRAEVTARTLEPGDYLPIDVNVNRSPNHSTIVVHVASDKRQVCTIDGNDIDGRLHSPVRLKVRPYMMADGTPHPTIHGVGKVTHGGG